MDPYFEVAAAEVRGFDLGDDAELTADLDGRRDDTEGGDLEGEDWLLLAILRHRANEDEDAIGCLERAVRLGHAEALARYLQFELELSRGELDEAAALLELAEEANQREALVPQAELVHARGSLRRARGRAEEALALYREALAADGSSAGRWRATGELLLELGRVREARDASLRAVEADPDDHESLYLLATTSALDGDTDGAVHWLGTLLQRDPDVRARARADERLARFGDSGLAHLLAPTPVPRSDWLARFPAWVSELRQNPVLERLGLRWLAEEESQELAERLSRAYGSGPLGTMHTAATLRRSRELLRTMCPVAYGPVSFTRDRVREPTVLFLDVEAADRLWLALSDSYPPFLWIDAGTAAASVADTLSEWFPPPRLDRLSMPAAARGFMGYRERFGVPSPYSGDIEPAGMSELDRHFALNPFVETATWGSAYADDPWPDQIPAQPGYVAKVAARQREVNEQAEGSVWSITRRTRHSRSYLSIEVHHRDIFVAEVRYRPTRHRDVIARMNEHFGCDYPEDMPIDAVAALLGFQFDGAEDMVTRLDATAEPEEIAGLLPVLSALRHSDLGMVRLYRRYMDHPEAMVRTTLCNIFAAYNYESLLEEMSLLEPDPDIREQIEQLLDEGIAIPGFDPYAADDHGSNGASV